MDQRTLAASLVDLGFSETVLADPAAGLRELEDRAERAPSDQRLARAVRWLADRVALDGHWPPVVAGVRRERLVRWDRVTATWSGTASTGEASMVRVLRPEAARDPVLRRQLVRDGRALRELIPIEVDQAFPALRVALAGAPVSPRHGDALARPALTALAHLARWEAQGLAVPPLSEEELRIGPAGDAAILCLTAAEGTPAAGIASIAAALVDPQDDGAVASALRALGGLPPGRVVEASRTMQRALTEVLVGRRHRLASGWRETWQRGREVRLREAVCGLLRAVPPPLGRGAVGVDLEGKITIVEARPGAVTWGVAGEAEAVYDLPEGFRPPIARRLLRARAASPPSAALDARIGGDPSATDAICRWVAAGLKLRTVQLLLDRDRG